MLILDNCQPYRNGSKEEKQPIPSHWLRGQLVDSLARKNWVYVMAQLLTPRWLGLVT